MSQIAPYPINHVTPRVPVRQWVLKGPVCDFATVSSSHIG
jgi:hypothetical protein